MRNVLGIVVACFCAALAVAACAEGSSPTSGDDDDDSGDGGAGGLASGSGAGTMTGGGSANGGSGVGGSGVGGSASGAGGTSPACVPAGDLSLMGTTGPCSVSQNCPTTTFTAVVSGAPGPVTDVDVSIEAIAASTDQNVVSLMSPQGTTVTLFNHHGTSLTDDFVGTMFDDDAPQSVAASPGPFHGCFKPVQPLSTFLGQPANGTWTLLVQTCLFETSVSSWTLHLEF